MPELLELFLVIIFYKVRSLQIVNVNTFEINNYKIAS